MVIGIIIFRIKLLYIVIFHWIYSLLILEIEVLLLNQSGTSYYSKITFKFIYIWTILRYQYLLLSFVNNLQI